MMTSTEIFDFKDVPPQWDHPFLHLESSYNKKNLEAFAYDYYMRFLPMFRKQTQGSIRPGVDIKFTRRMKNQLGSASVYSGEIRLNLNYFENQAALLPYTLYHEMTHIWLYDCHYDPGHTKRFYNKMSEFERTGLPVDKSVHIHKRIQTEGRFVYTCPECMKRWYNHKRFRRAFYCGPCHETHGLKKIMDVAKNTEETRRSHLEIFSLI